MKKLNREMQIRKKIADLAYTHIKEVNREREMKLRNDLASLARRYDASVGELTFAFCMVIRDDYGWHNYKEAINIVLETLNKKFG